MCSFRAKTPTFESISVYQFSRFGINKVVAFDRIYLAPVDPIFGLAVTFQRDARENKIDLGIGIYRGEGVQAPILESVKRAEEEILSRESSKTYLPIAGDPEYIDRVGELVFGSDFWEKERARIAGFQTVGGTGALRIGGAFLKEEWNRPIFISSPTWPNHRGVFRGCKLDVHFYPYYDLQNSLFEKENAFAFFRRLERGSIVVLHGSCHNPTGWDFTQEEWQKLVSLFAEKECVPFIDSAYLGFGKELEEDAYGIRAFAASGLDFLVAFSASKIFSLYGERVGALFIGTSKASVAENVASRVQQAIRMEYSNPPIHGSTIVSFILSNAALHKKWERELNEMRKTMEHMRQKFALRLEKELPKQSFIHVKEGKGMFTCLKLTQEEIQRLQNEYAIYMTRDARINLSGLHAENLDTVVQAIAAVSKN